MYYRYFYIENSFTRSDVSGMVGKPLFYSITFLLLLYHGCSSSFYFLARKIFQWKAKSESLVQ